MKRPTARRSPQVCRRSRAEYPAINERLKGGRNGGLPWLIVLDAEGKEIATSNKDPKGDNIGAPVQPDECAWFGTMLERSRGDKVSKEQLGAMLADLEEFAKPKRRT